MSVIISYVKYVLLWVCVELVLLELTDAGRNGLFVVACSCRESLQRQRTL